MFQIKLTPTMLLPGDDRQLTLYAQGDALTINGQTYDFSPLPEGATLPRAAVECEWLASDIERIDGALHLTLILPHGPNAPEVTRFPAPIAVTGDGPVALPPYDIEDEDHADD